jgi:hypothetical protein
MKKLYDFIKYDNLKLSEIDKTYLLQLDYRYKELYQTYWDDWYDSGVSNLDSEFDKFMEERAKNKKYFPQLKITLDKLTTQFLNDCLSLRNKFERFNCFLSQFYIGKIDEMYYQAQWALYPSKNTLKQINDYLYIDIDDKLYNKAVKILEDHPWEDVSEDQYMSGKDVVPKLQDHIDKLGYDYSAVLNPHLLARMKVIPNKPELEIKTSAKYSDIDVESLKVHEVEVHCGRRYFGMQQGLYLMLDGLPGRNTLDEGMAIYNSFHHNPLGVKPNLWWKVAIKVYIAKHLDKDFCELFDMIKKMCPTAPDKEIFDNLCRMKRMLKDTRLPGGDMMIQCDYLVGYLMIKKMTDKMRKDILHYNIGPEQIKLLPKLKKFFKLNKFEPITKKDMI